MKCRICGKEIEAGEKYCLSCGTDMESERVCINRDPKLYGTKKNDTEIKSTTHNSKKIKVPNKKTAIIIAIAVAVIVVVIIIIISATHNKADEDSAILQTELPVITEEAVPAAVEIATSEPTLIPTPEPTAETVRRGTAEPIPQEVREQMSGLSYKPNNNISLDDLSYLTIPHYDFNYEVQYGHMVVNASLADEVLDIFAELFDIKYPIERMELVDKYGADDFESIEYNNTSSFNYRESTTGSGNLSMHALGRAIDINPQINPYVNSSGTGSHENAREYWNRDSSIWSSEIAKAAYIGSDTEIYRIFTSRGWTWGGNWSSYRDYQHFEK